MEEKNRVLEDAVKRAPSVPEDGLPSFLAETRDKLARIPDPGEVEFYRSRSAQNACARRLEEWSQQAKQGDVA